MPSITWSSLSEISLILVVLPWGIGILSDEPTTIWGRFEGLCKNNTQHNQFRKILSLKKKIKEVDRVC